MSGQRAARVYSENSAQASANLLDGPSKLVDLRLARPGEEAGVIEEVACNAKECGDRVSVLRWSCPSLTTGRTACTS